MKVTASLGTYSSSSNIGQLNDQGRLFASVLSDVMLEDALEAGVKTQERDVCKDKRQL